MNSKYKLVGGEAKRSGSTKIVPYSTRACESQGDFGGKPAGERSHQPDDGLLLLPVKSAVTFTARQHHRPWAGTKLYCRVTEAHVC